MMSSYIDVHCHVLPGVDDGSPDMETTLQMIEASYQQGIRTMIATPHYYTGHRNCSGEKLQAVYEAARDKIREVYPDFTLLLGNEIYYKREAVERLKQKDIFTMAQSRYVLVEFNVRGDYKDVEDAVRSLVQAGYYPILAHVERYQCLWKREDRVRELIRMGAYIQVNGENFTKGLINPSRKYCVRLIEQGLVHFLGSDCHNLVDRNQNLGNAVTYLQGKVDQKRLEQILDHPNWILENRCIS